MAAAAAAAAALPTRALGQQGLQASCIGLGCMSLTPGLYDAADLTEEQAAAVVKRALDLGVTLLNTSDLYGPYTNEQLLGKAHAHAHTPTALARQTALASNAPLPAGRALQGRRDSVVIATTWGPMFKEGGGFVMRMRASARRVPARCATAAPPWASA